VAQKRKKTSREQVSATRKKKRGLSAADAKHFRELLLQKRREILKNVTEFEDEALRKSRLDASGDLSCMPIHMADLGTDNYEQEFSLGLMDSERKLLREIDNALGRIENKTYGICEATGKPISRARLEAQPWARYCVEYARLLEQGLAEEPEE
jgi:DnaK suppressor protein